MTVDVPTAVLDLLHAIDAARYPPVPVGGDSGGDTDAGSIWDDPRFGLCPVTP